MIPGDKDAMSGDLRQRGPRISPPLSDSSSSNLKEIPEEKDPSGSH